MGTVGKRPGQAAPSEEQEMLQPFGEGEVEDGAGQGWESLALQLPFNCGKLSLGLDHFGVPGTLGASRICWEVTL